MLKLLNLNTPGIASIVNYVLFADVFYQNNNYRFLRNYYQCYVVNCAAL